jgi:FkbM family methyltransferase
MRRIVRLGRTVLERILGYRFIVDTSAQLPGWLRSGLSYRVLSVAAQRVDAQQPRLVLSNLGMRSRYRCLLPATNHLALYGKPTLYAGERGALYLASCLAKCSDAFVDVGAHIGYFLFFLRDAVSVPIPMYFFEPDPELFARIEDNIQRNGLVAVHGFNAAMGSTDGTASFFKNLTTSSSGSLTAPFSPAHTTVEMTVPLLSFATVAKKAGFTKACVKVDIEGAEQDFFTGVKDSVHTLAFLIIEVLGPAIQAGFVQQLIKTWRFHAYYINDLTLEHARDGAFTYRAGQFNWLFCRESPEQLRDLVRGSPLRVKV